MTDLVDYLRAKMADCQCEGAYFVGRPSLGHVTIKKWSPACRVHTTKAELEAENDRARELLNEAWARQQEAELASSRRFLESMLPPKPWWRRR